MKLAVIAGILVICAYLIFGFHVEAWILALPAAILIIGVAFGDG